MSNITKAYWLLLTIFAAVFVNHLMVFGGRISSISPQDEYVLDQSVQVTDALSDIQMEMYIPASGNGVEIRDEQFEVADLELELEDTNDGRLLVLNGFHSSLGRNLRYRARLRSLSEEYRIDPTLSWDSLTTSDSINLVSTEEIQVDADEFAARLAEIFALKFTPELYAWETTDWQRILGQSGLGPVQAMETVYRHCLNDIQNATFSGTTDAITTLKLGKASCSGKSRLMVALCRRLGIPARIVGGIILGQGGQKRTHHLWVELNLKSAWVPCDPLNGYFGIRPSRYLPLYRGDRALITHSRGMTIDYGFSSTKHSLPLIWLDGSDKGFFETEEKRKTLVPLLEQHNFSAILLAPFALLMIVFARQVIGIQSFGLFLPILLGYSLIQANWLIVGIQMALAVLLGVLTRFLIARLNLLHVPRTAVMITLLVFLYIVFSAVMRDIGSVRELGAAILPLAALAMAIERFTVVAMDLGTRSALGMLLQTILLSIGCRIILVTPFFQNLTVSFPEVLILVIAMIMIVGSYRGLRWMEFGRFNPLLQKESS